VKENKPEIRGRKKRGTGGVSLWCILLLSLLAFPFATTGTGVVSAQSIVGGDVKGQVTDEAGRAIRGASVTLLESRSGLQWNVRTRTDGALTFESVPGGTYQMRVEALGYRPVVILGLGVTPGEAAQVSLRLVAEPPPLTRIDTIRFAAAGGAVPVLGLRADGSTLSALPDRIRDMRGFLALSSWADGQGGLEGLPAYMTTVYADGEPVRSARHPGMAGVGDPMALLFPRVGLQSVTVRTGLEDIEWSGAAGIVVSLETRPPLAETSGELFGFWSGGPTWTNEVVGEGPDMMSAWGGGSASVPLVEGRSALSLSFEGAMVETPNLFWRNDYFTRRVVAEAPLPGTRTSGYGSGMARTGWTFGESGRVTLRGGFSAFKNESDRFGTHQAGYGTEMPGEGTDGSVSAIVAFPVSERARMEVRGSGNFSTRSWGDVDNPETGAFLVGDRAFLGTDAAFPASADRVDLAITPVAHFRLGENRIKVGARLEYGSFDMTHADQAAGSYFFGSRSGLLAGQGAAIVLDDAAPSESFSISRATLFGQYQWSAAPGLDLTTGISYKVENLPSQDIQPALEWAALTGVENVNGRNGIGAVGGRVHFRWDVQQTGRTWIMGGMGLEHGVLDPTAMYEVLAMDGQVDVTRALGTGLAWQQNRITGANSVTGTRLALFGPDLQSPRTARGALGFYHTLEQGVRFGLSGSFRRTEAILRRADLNRLLVPSGMDQNGRPLYGELDIVSGVLGADPGTNRRFPGYESVWALNSDGWSRYVGVTASLEAPIGDGGFLSLQYTWSETTDNWVGASRSGALAQLGADIGVEDWDEATSDFDVPHRLTALAVVPLPLPWGGEVTGLYSLRSDLPFTPRVAAGLDANGDGSPFNDVAFVPTSGPAIEALAQEWDCLSGAQGTFAERNSCRGDAIHTLDLRLSLGLPPVAGISSRLVVDGLNLTDRDMGLRDDNLLLLRSGTLNPVNGGVEVPYKVNPGFGNWVYRGDTGRMVRVGIRIGGGR